MIMDEPTAALGIKESASLLTLIKNLVSMVKGIVVISHNIDQIVDIAHRAVVLRRGKRVGEVDISSSQDKDGTHNELVAMITGL